MREAAIERKLRTRVKALGGVAVKLNPHSCVGVPDRLCVLPGRIVFVELKAPTGKGRVSAKQHEWAAKITALGHEYARIDSVDALEELLPHGSETNPGRNDPGCP